MLLTYGTSFILVLLSSVEPSAETTQPKEPLPLGVVLDSQGRPITIPSSNQASLEYQSKEASVSSPKKPTRATKKKTKKKAKRSSHKRQFASRTNVANDPSCRWLNQRMKELEKKQSLDKSHHQQELKIRNKEWKCMKCGAEGPKQKDYDRCQYKR